MRTTVQMLHHVTTTRSRPGSLGVVVAQWSGTLQQNCEAKGSNVAPEVGKGLGAWLWQSLLYDKMFKAN